MDYIPGVRIDLSGVCTWQVSSGVCQRWKLIQNCRHTLCWGKGISAVHFVSLNSPLRTEQRWAIRSRGSTVAPLSTFSEQCPQFQTLNSLHTFCTLLKDQLQQQALAYDLSMGVGQYWNVSAHLHAWVTGTCPELGCCTWRPCQSWTTLPFTFTV